MYTEKLSFKNNEKKNIFRKTKTERIYQNQILTKGALKMDFREKESQPRKNSKHMGNSKIMPVT